MRFCMVTTFYPPYHFGGDAVFVRALARALVAHGHEVEVVHCEDAYRLGGGATPEKVEDNDDGVIVHRLHSRWGAVSPIITQQTGRPGLKRRALREILNRPFDVVHFHNISLIGGPGVLAMARSPVRLYTTHEHWLVCPTHVLWKDGRKPCDKQECFRCCLRARTPPQLWRQTGMLKRALRHIDALLAPSHFTAARHQAAGFDVPIRVLPSFATIDAPPYPSRAKPARERARFLYVGRLSVSKGIVALLEEFGRLPQHDLFVAGDGELLDSLVNQYANCPHIHFLGPVPRDRLVALYQDATALILPSIGPEVFPLVVLEAMACGTPVIVHDAGGSADAVRLTGGGIVYQTSQELNDAVRRISEDSTERGTLARLARLGYEEHYTPDAHVNAYLGHVRAIQEAKGIVSRATEAALVR